MAVFKCKMCGGNLEIQEGMTVCECEYCGSMQTVPVLDNEKKVNLFTRANRLRSACEFDKAAGVYESIVAEFQEEAEAYWGLILCKFGIEYVDDPKTEKKIPTCHRSSFDSVMDDANFELVMEYSDPSSRAVYREEAKAIEKLRTGIIEVSAKEEPYDIFICYKETDAMGERTIDSVIAQDVYDVLTEKGYRVFFSRITLEDKLGQEYEPYIFAALNSAKVMLAFGTDYEYYNAVWVKNEWSRFLNLIEKGEKKTLIPCFKGIDAYDMPKEFARLQAQDMGKVGAVQDLVRGIGKILGTKDVSNGNGFSGAVNAEGAALTQRGTMALEDGDFKGAENYFERALDINPADARAYLGKFMAYYGLTSLSDLDDKVCWIEDNKEFKRAEQFADAKLAKELKAVKEANELKIQRLRFNNVLKKYYSNRSAEEDKVKKLVSYSQKIEALLEKVRNLKLTREQYRVLHKCVIHSGAYIAYICQDGTVKEHYTGGRAELYRKGSSLSKWKNVVEIVGDDYRCFGLTEEGKVLSAFPSYGPHAPGWVKQQLDFWKEIVSIEYTYDRLFGVTIDGCVKALMINDSYQTKSSDKKIWEKFETSLNQIENVAELRILSCSNQKICPTFMLAVFLKNGKKEIYKDTQEGLIKIETIKDTSIFDISLTDDGDLIGITQNRSVVNLSKNREAGVQNIVCLLGNKSGNVCVLDDSGSYHSYKMKFQDDGIFDLYENEDYLNMKIENEDLWKKIKMHIGMLSYSSAYSPGIRVDGKICNIVSGKYGERYEEVEVFEDADQYIASRMESRQAILNKIAEKEIEQERLRKMAYENVLNQYEKCKSEIVALESELKEKQDELENLHGIFAFTKKGNIEKRIAYLQGEIEKKKAEISSVEEELKQYDES